MVDTFVHRVKSELLPIEYLSMKFSPGVIHFYNVVFVEDFGVFRSGEFFICLTFHVLSGKLIGNDKEQDFKVYPCYCNI